MTKRRRARPTHPTPARPRAATDGEDDLASPTGSTPASVAVAGVRPDEGDLPHGSDRNRTQRLDLAAESGVWVVSSVSATRYYLDLDAGLLLRRPGELSATGPYDGVWVRLLKVTNLNGTGVVEVGLRHKYDLDPGPTTPYSRWWVQRTVTAIRTVAPSDRPAGRTPGRDEESRPYLHPRTEAAHDQSAPPDGGDDARA